MERAVLMARGNWIQAARFGLHGPRGAGQSLDELSLEAVEAILIRKALARTGGQREPGGGGAGAEPGRALSAHGKVWPLIRLGRRDPGRRGKDRLQRMPLSKSGRRLSFERRVQLWLTLLGVPAALLLFTVLHEQRFDTVAQWVALTIFCGAWLLAVSLLKEQIVRPLQTLANVVASLREDDFSFRARGGRRNDAMGDLALEINALANSLQRQRTGALEAMALLERVMSSMQSPVLAFDMEGRLRLLNAAGERVFGVRGGAATGRSAEELGLEPLMQLGDDEVFPVGGAGTADALHGEAIQLQTARAATSTARAVGCERGAAGGRATGLGAADSRAGSRDK